LNGLVAEGAIGRDAALDSSSQAGVIGGCGRGAFASGKAEGKGENCGGQDSLKGGDILASVHGSSFLRKALENTVNQGA
jgi:hypothetical protein